MCVVWPQQGNQFITTNESNTQVQKYYPHADRGPVSDCTWVTHHIVQISHSHIAKTADTNQILIKESLVVFCSKFKSCSLHINNKIIVRIDMNEFQKRNPSQFIILLDTVLRTMVLFIQYLAQLLVVLFLFNFSL